jgi:hypothetical protein
MDLAAPVVERSTMPRVNRVRSGLLMTRNVMERVGLWRCTPWPLCVAAMKIVLGVLSTAATTIYQNPLHLRHR